MRIIRGAWSDETAHAQGKQSGRSLVEAKADCVYAGILQVVAGLHQTTMFGPFMETPYIQALPTKITLVH